jgi:hypothetical protein
MRLRSFIKLLLLLALVGCALAPASDPLPCV